MPTASSHKSEDTAAATCTRSLDLMAVAPFCLSHHDHTTDASVMCITLVQQCQDHGLLQCAREGRWNQDGESAN